MNKSWGAFLFLIFLFGVPCGHAGEVRVPGGSYQPLFVDKGDDLVKVGSLLVDSTPVTNKEFLKFVQIHSRWQKGNVSSLFADDTYLEHWLGPKLFSQKMSEYPVVQVSWFAARAYCSAQGKRLPTTAEWEYFSQTNDATYERETLKWYSLVQPPRKAVGQGTANKWGIYDTTGLIWEWVEDFSGAIMPGDSREGPMRDMFCGGAALGSKDPSKYAAFMRYAFRSSLKAQYTTSTLGFRCVKDISVEEKNEESKSTNSVSSVSGSSWRPGSPPSSSRRGGAEGRKSQRRISLSARE